MHSFPTLPLTTASIVFFNRCENLSRRIFPILLFKLHASEDTATFSTPVQQETHNKVPRASSASASSPLHSSQPLLRSKAREIHLTPGKHFLEQKKAFDSLEHKLRDVWTSELTGLFDIDAPNSEVKDDVSVSILEAKRAPAQAFWCAVRSDLEMFHSMREVDTFFSYITCYFENCLRLRNQLTPIKTIDVPDTTVGQNGCEVKEDLSSSTSQVQGEKNSNPICPSAFYDLLPPQSLWLELIDVSLFSDIEMQSLGYVVPVSSRVPFANGDFTLRLVSYWNNFYMDIWRHRNASKTVDKRTNSSEISKLKKEIQTSHCKESKQEFPLPNATKNSSMHPIRESDLKSVFSKAVVVLAKLFQPGEARNLLLGNPQEKSIFSVSFFPQFSPDVQHELLFVFALGFLKSGHRPLSKRLEALSLFTDLIHCLPNGMKSFLTPSSSSDDTLLAAESARVILLCYAIKQMAEILPPTSSVKSAFSNLVEHIHDTLYVPLNNILRQIDSNWFDTHFPRDGIPTNRSDLESFCHGPSSKLSNRKETDKAPESDTETNENAVSSSSSSLKDTILHDLSIFMLQLYAHQRHEVTTTFFHTLSESLGELLPRHCHALIRFYLLEHNLVAAVETLRALATKYGRLGSSSSSPLSDLDKMAFQIAHDEVICALTSPRAKIEGKALDPTDSNNANLSALKLKPKEEKNTISFGSSGVISSKEEAEKTFVDAKSFFSKKGNESVKLKISPPGVLPSAPYGDGCDAAPPEEVATGYQIFLLHRSFGYRPSRAALESLTSALSVRGDGAVFPAVDVALSGATFLETPTMAAFSVMTKHNAERSNDLEVEKKRGEQENDVEDELGIKKSADSLKSVFDLPDDDHTADSEVLGSSSRSVLSLSVIEHLFATCYYQNDRSRARQLFRSLSSANPGVVFHLSAQTQEMLQRLEVADFCPTHLFHPDAREKAEDRNLCHLPPLKSEKGSCEGTA